MSGSRKVEYDTTSPAKKSKSLKNNTFSLSVKEKPEKTKSLETEAINEILKDTKRGAIRSEISGAYGWGSAPKINSRLFGNTLIQVIQTNRRKNSGGIIKRSHSNRQYTPTYLSSNKMSGTVKSDIDSKKDHSSSMRQDSKKVSSECNKSLP